MAELQIPEDAKVTSDLDCVLLTNWPSYRSQLVRLAACEKKLKWKHKVIDHVGKMTQLEPWYINKNPGGYVPTMYVHPDNTAVCESAVIMEYIENNFNGPDYPVLLPKDDEVKMARYKQLYDLHEDWDVEAYSIGWMRKTNWFMGNMLPGMMMRSNTRILERIQQVPQNKEIYMKKLDGLKDRYYSTGSEKELQESWDKGSKILQLVEGWLSEPGAEFVLGAGASYSLADVFITTMLTRLTMNKGYFKREVSARPNLAKYWERVKKRPSKKEAKLDEPPLPTTCGIFIGLTLIQSILSAILAGILSAFIENVSFWFLWLYCFLGVATLLYTFISCFMCKGKAKMKAHLAKLEAGQYMGGEEEHIGLNTDKKNVDIYSRLV